MAIGDSDERLSNKVGSGEMSSKGAGAIKAKDGHQAGKLVWRRLQYLSTFATPPPCGCFDVAASNISDATPLRQINRQGRH